MTRWWIPFQLIFLYLYIIFFLWVPYLLKFCVARWRNGRLFRHVLDKLLVCDQVYTLPLLEGSIEPKQPWTDEKNLLSGVSLTLISRKTEYHRNFKMSGSGARFGSTYTKTSVFLFFFCWDLDVYIVCNDTYTVLITGSSRGYGTVNLHIEKDTRNNSFFKIEKKMVSNWLHAFLFSDSTNRKWIWWSFLFVELIMDKFLRELFFSKLDFILKGIKKTWFLLSSKEIKNLVAS